MVVLVYREKLLRIMVNDRIVILYYWMNFKLVSLLSSFYFKNGDEIRLVLVDILCEKNDCRSRINWKILKDFGIIKL